MPTVVFLHPRHRMQSFPKCPQDRINPMAVLS
jgi:hypothetical protein